MHYIFLRSSILLKHKGGKHNGKDVNRNIKKELRGSKH